MKPITIIFEITGIHDEKSWWKPGYHSAPFNGERMRRIWWLWFAIAWVRCDHYSYHEYVASGCSQWIDQ